MITIIQVLGSLRSYKVANFKFINENGPIPAPLSSIALYKYYTEIKKIEKSSIKLIYYVPESLIVDYINLSEINDLANNYQNALKTFKEQYTQGLTNLIGSEISFETKIIHSIGVYYSRNFNYTITFNNYIENIITQFLLDLLDINDQLVVDISTGFNFYTQALNEVTRNLLVYNKLKNILQNNFKLKIQCSIVPPIISPQPSWTYPITFLEVRAKVFFEFPYQNLNSFEKFFSVKEFPTENNTEKGEIGKQLPQITNGDKNEIIYPVLTAINAIKHNCPLAFFTKEIIKFDKNQNLLNFQLDRLKNLMSFTEQFINFEVNDNNIIIYRLKVKKTNLVNYLFTIALHQSLKNFYLSEIDSKPPEISNIEKIFETLYSNLNLGTNKRFLARDLKFIKIMGEKLDKGEEKQLNLLKSSEGLIPKNRIEDDKNFSDQKRNFFAHSGLLSDFIKLKKGKTNDEKLEINYIEKNIKLIKSWIENPE